MPLASSRDASRQREAAAAAAAARAARAAGAGRRGGKARLSLPATCPSSTSVDAGSVARRRASLAAAAASRRASAAGAAAKENVGPTPYYVVAQERGGDMSPRLTRSAQKSKPPPAVVVKDGGVQLNFSPPNEEKNRQREHAMEEQRQARIQRNRTKGQLLEFNMNSMQPDYMFPDTPAKVDPPTDRSAAASATQPSGGDVSSLADSTVAPALPAVDAKAIIGDIQEMLHREVAELGQVRRESDDRKLQLLLESLEQRKRDYEEAGAKLEAQNQELTAELAAARAERQQDRDEHLVAVTRLQTALAEYEKHAERQVEGCKAEQRQLEDRLAALVAEKTAQVERCLRFERELADAQVELQTSREAQAALRHEREAEQGSRDAELEEVQQSNAALRDDVRTLQQSNRDLDAKVQEYERLMDKLKSSVIPDLEAKLRDALREVSAKDGTIAEMKATIDRLGVQVQDLTRKSNRWQRDFESLQAASSQEVAGISQAVAEKDTKIGELFRQLGESQKIMTEKEKECALMVQRLQDLERSWSEQLAERDVALEFAQRQVEEAESVKNTFAQKMEALEAALSDEQKQREAVERELRDAQERAEAESHNVRGLTEREQVFQSRTRELEHKLFEMERNLKQTQQERDDARTNMAGFNERENELYRKLREGDLVRRDLHARVMQLAGNIRVFVRVRPALSQEISTNEAAAGKENGKRKRDAVDSDDVLFRYPGVYDRCEKTSKVLESSCNDITKNMIIVTEPYKDRGGLKDRRKQWKFGFDSVFSPDHGQQEVWDATEPLIQSTIDGFNVTVFAYGQTGSGKTFTMLGEDGSEGIIGRSVKKLFSAKAEMEEISRGATTVQLSVELLEVYNEKVFDLLADNGGANGRELALKVTSKEVVGNVVVSTPTSVDVLKYLALAQKRRCVKSTCSNKESSRSHMIFTIHFVCTSRDGGVRRGKLNVCDLAGSERLSKSGAHHVGGALLEETKNINKSLSVLSNVIERLQAGDKNVPFRESKLTFLLQDSLGGNSKTLAIVCCNPLNDHFHESLCSLKFAEKVNKVDLKAVANFSA